MVCKYFIFCCVFFLIFLRRYVVFIYLRIVYYLIFCIYLFLYFMYLEMFFIKLFFVVYFEFWFFFFWEFEIWLIDRIYNIESFILDLMNCKMNIFVMYMYIGLLVFVDNICMYKFVFIRWRYKLLIFEFVVLDNGG